MLNREPGWFSSYGDHPSGNISTIELFSPHVLRERSLLMVVMVALSLEMIWRQISGASEMVRLIQTEAVAEALHQPFAAISIEMFFRSLYFFTQAYHRSETHDFVSYLAENARLLGIMKLKRKSVHPSPLKFNPALLTSSSLPYL